MKRDDSLWKAILEDLFDDFLRFFFKGEADQFAFEKGFEFLDKELEQLFPTEGRGAYPKFVDKLVKVFTKAGKEEWVLVHVEVQGYDDVDFGKRMYTYFYRILDRYNKPVTCVAIFTDSNKNFRPSGFNYEFLGTKNSFSFNTYKVIDQQENELRESSNPFAIVILTVLLALQKGKITEEELFKLKIGLFKNLLQKQISQEKIRALMIFLHNYVCFDNAELISKFDHEINLITNMHTTMGIEQFILQRVKDEALEEGMEKGMEKGIEKGIEIERTEKNFNFVKNLLIQTKFSIKKIARLADVTVSFVQEVKASLPKS